MTLLPDISGSEAEPPEIRLHRWHEGENAGCLLGTRTPVPFLLHCRRRAQSDPLQYFALQTGQVCGSRTHPTIHQRGEKERESGIQKPDAPRPSPEKKGAEGGCSKIETTSSETPLTRPPRPRLP